MFRALGDFLLLRKHQKKASPSEIESFQLESLQNMVEYAKAHSPFYRRLYEDKPVQTLADFYRLPTIDKTVMMENFSGLNTCGLDKDAVMGYALEKEKNKDYLGYYQDEYVVGLSSGTSGNKGLYITPRSMTKRLPAVFLARSGLSLRDLPYRILFLLRVFSQGFNDINAPFIQLRYLSTMTPPKDIIAEMNHSKTNVLMAPPSLLRVLVPLSAAITTKLKKVITYAEVLTEEDKVMFQNAFHAKVIEIYQASEGQMASACSCGRLHINEDLVFVEVYDENDQLITKPHVVGHHMLVTNLINFAQPLIRYKMNDMIVLDDPCPCGSHFRTIKNIIGRHDDLLYFYGKDLKIRYVFPDLFARWIITESDAIREFQVIQDDIGELAITLDAKSDFDPKRLRTRLEKELQAIGLSATIDIQIGPIPLPPDKNKFKRFISHLKKILPGQ
jgi:putative adenylate-forming enzyme